MKKIRVEDAVGMKLCHDITKVIPGEFKGRAFAKGHVIKEGDIEELKKIGKEHVFVWEENAGEIHEDEAALRMAEAVVGPNIIFEEPQEGKSLLKATNRGLFQLNRKLLKEINKREQITLPTIPNNYKAEKGMKVAAARVIPLVIAEDKIMEIENICAQKGPVLKVVPYKQLKVGFIITGNEVYKGRIKDKFGPVLKQKMAYFGANILGQVYCPDDLSVIEKAIYSFKKNGADLIVLTGGMSVDPDDLTPGAIKNTATELITYGVPAQPGNMFMMAYLDDTAVIGVPGAAIFFKTTIVDVVLPRIFAGDKLCKDDFAEMGEGGLCLNCEVCTYPRCYFGR